MKLKDLYISLIKEGRPYKITDLDIRYLISYFLKFKDSSSFFLKLDNEIDNAKEIKKAFDVLKSGIPISYLIHETNFLGEKYIVDKGVLIPRVETEELVNLAIHHIQKMFNGKNINILDVGTGTGVIAINLKKAFKNADVFASDISSIALNNAKKNAKKHKVDVTFNEVDVFTNNDVKYDVIISNPPYIKDINAVDKSVLDYEPHNALFIDEDNNVYKKILMNVDKLNEPSLLLFEIDPSLEDELISLISEYLPTSSYVFSKDINKKTRFLTIVNA